MDVWLREEDCNQIMRYCKHHVFTSQKFNQYCMKVALQTNLKKENAQHNGLPQLSLGGSTEQWHWMIIDDLSSGIFCLRPEIQASLRHAKPGMYM